MVHSGNCSSGQLTQQPTVLQHPCNSTAALLTWHALLHPHLLWSQLLLRLLLLALLLLAAHVELAHQFIHPALILGLHSRHKHTQDLVGLLLLCPNCHRDVFGQTHQAGQGRMQVPHAAARYLC